MNTLLKKNILLCILLAIVFIACTGGLVYFFVSMRKKTLVVREIKERVVSYQKNKESLTDETTKLRSLDTRVQALEKYLITVETIPELLTSLESLAMSNEVRFEITSVQTPTEENGGTLRIETTTKGSYEKVQGFLALVQHQPFEVVISKLFLFSDDASTVAQAGVLSATPITTASKEKQWQGVATIDIVSF